MAAVAEKSTVSVPKHLFMGSEHSHQLLFEPIGGVEGESLNNFILLAVTLLREFALFPSQLAEESSWVLLLCLFCK